MERNSRRGLQCYGVEGSGPSAVLILYVRRTPTLKTTDNELKGARRGRRQLAENGVLGWE
uniref:Uncharacterized protein n=1 Tax=Cucumis sativus TaxID=3659 RepID=A0A0A0KU12_CUCSA